MDTFKARIVKRTPTREQIQPVFAVTVVIVFTWTLYRMFWYLPSWMGDFDILEVLTISAYVNVFALLESSIIFGILLLIGFLLPGKVLRETFVPTGCTLITITGFSAYLLQRKMKTIYKLELLQLVIYPILILAAILILVFVLSWIFRRFKFIARIVTLIAERMTVFLYIYIPLSVLSFVLLLARKIF